MPGRGQVITVHEEGRVDKLEGDDGDSVKSKEKWSGVEHAWEAEVPVP